MDAAREGSLLIFALNVFESRLLLHALREIEMHYAIKPDQIDDRTAAVWYSTRGCETAGMSVEEVREWREHLHSFKQANLDLVRRWEEELMERRPGRHELRIKLEEATAFLTVVNDHRLLLAARHEIEQEEMDLHMFSQLSTLSPPRQAALYEIHLLAYIMEEVLSLLNQEEG